jgi:hypothetical protein
VHDVGGVGFGAIVVIARGGRFEALEIAFLCRSARLISTGTGAYSQIASWPTRWQLPHGEPPKHLILLRDVKKPTRISPRPKEQGTIVSTAGYSHSPAAAVCAGHGDTCRVRLGVASSGADGRTGEERAERDILYIPERRIQAEAGGRRSWEWQVETRRDHLSGGVCLGLQGCEEVDV